MHSGVASVLQVSTMCCDAFKKLFKQDKVGVASLAAVRVISGLVKSLSYNMKPEVESRCLYKICPALECGRKCRLQIM